MANKFECSVSPMEGKKYKISIWDNIEAYEDYEKLFENLDRITAKDRVELQVMSPGGRCDIGFTLFNRIYSLPCRVDVLVPYPVYSMGAILALCGDTLEVGEGAFLMFHDYSTGARGKGNEIFKQTEAYKSSFAHMFNKACRPFLTKKECDNILNGHDMYVQWDDVKLEDRIKRHFKG